MSTENVASTVLLGMGKGSGIDIVKLARDLTDVEKAPRESKLNASIEESQDLRLGSPEVQRAVVDRPIQFAK